MKSIRQLLCLTLATAVLAACSKPPVPEIPLKPLRVVKVSPGGTAQEGDGPIYSGDLRPRVASLLGFQVAGKIVARYVNAGDHVVAGQVLARLDPADLKLTVAQAEAQRVQAHSEAARYRELRDKHFVSAAALDGRETALKTAEAQAALTRNQEAHTVLKADKAGIIGMVMADVGKVVAPGEVVFRLAPDGDREIAFDIPEHDFARVRPGVPAEVTLFALPGKIFQGVVREVAPLADPATRMYPVRVQMTGVDQLPTGLTASVRVRSTDATAAVPGIAIPMTAIFQQEKAMAVWLVGPDDTVSLQAVEVAKFGEQTAIVTKGLSGGERIAAAGVNRLTAGQKVRPVEVTAIEASK